MSKVRMNRASQIRDAKSHRRRDRKRRKRKRQTIDVRLLEVTVGYQVDDRRARRRKWAET